MNLKQFFPFITVDPVNLSIKGKLLAAISGSIAIFAVAWITHLSGADSAYPIIVASMGASAVILFILPSSPLAQPWPLIGGQLVSAVIGVACARMVTDTVLASTCAVGGSILAMLLLRCLHPPGAATALTPVIASDPGLMEYSFVLLPVGVNVAVMLLVAIVLNRWVLGYGYPTATYLPDPKQRKNKPNIQASPRTGISEQDVELALENVDRFIDVSTGDLSKLFTDAQRQSFKRNRGNVICADIMAREIVAVEYGTEVEDAWKMMCDNKVKALPVIDRSHRVIGIITWHDFFKFIDGDAPGSFAEKFRAFIRRTPDVTAKKPESVGHIMVSPVSVISESSHIVELIPLMVDQGYRQIPVVNKEKRLVGMVHQANLIAALYNHSHDHALH
jgi:CBS domain-containing membrane protein